MIKKCQNVNHKGTGWFTASESVIIESLCACKEEQQDRIFLS